MSLADYFLQPAWWPLLFLVPLASLAMYLANRKRKLNRLRMLGSRASARLLDLESRRRSLGALLVIGGVLFALVTFMEPAWEKGPQAHEQRGVDVMICLDVSRSMLAQDQEPGRLAAAKREITALANRARGDRLGLVAFAGEARLISPLTLDRKSLVEMLAQVDQLSVEQGGSKPGSALALSLSALGETTGEHEAIILLTDGEDPAQQGLAVAQKCRARGVRVHCVGFGSLAGSKIPLEKSGGGGFLRDRQGREVVTAMDPEALGRIARAGGGEFLNATTMPLPLVELYEKRLLPLARKVFETSHRLERCNRFQWSLLAAFILWILAWCINERKS